VRRPSRGRQARLARVQGAEHGALVIQNPTTSPRLLFSRMVLLSINDS
jgi:hypothetical protein